MRAAPRKARHVEPRYSHRVDVEQVANSFASAEEAFEAGDYLIVARHDGASPELRARALAFSGHSEKSVEIFRELKRISNAGRIAYGFALWCLGMDNPALDVLTQVSPGDPEHGLALGLADLVRTAEIPVFIVACLTPHRTTPDDDELQPTFRRGQFHLKHVATQLPRNAYQYDGTEPFDRFLRIPTKRAIDSERRRPSIPINGGQGFR